MYTRMQTHMYVYIYIHIYIYTFVVVDLATLSKLIGPVKPNTYKPWTKTQCCPAPSLPCAKQFIAVCNRSSARPPGRLLDRQPAGAPACPIARQSARPLARPSAR